MLESSEETVVVPPARYCLDARPFASGAMGEVFEAHDGALNRKVAVKTLKRHFAGHPEAVRMFREEARITGQLQHPAIPPVHDLGTLPDGRPFLAMKLIKGQTLADILKSRPDPADDRPRFLHVFEQICQAVGFAHERNVIHRDLKPSNVMVGAFGEVQVMDWGLAKVLSDAPCAGEPPAESDAQLTRIETGDERDPTHAGALKGTLAYMPPEQARGEVHLIDRRSDVFALGAILCVVLTGEPPYTGTSPAEVDLGERAGLHGAELVKFAARMGLLGGALERLDACGADPELIALAKGCLSPKPIDRPADARAVAGSVAAYREAVEARAEQDRLARNAAAIDLLLGQCEAVLGTDDAAKAAILLEQAESRSADGGADFADRLDKCRRELAMLKELDRIDDLRWTLTEGTWAERNRLAAMWSEAFHHFGIRISPARVEDATERINDSYLRDRLLASLDAWLAAAPSDELLAVLRAADPDGYRNEVREAIRAEDIGRLCDLCHRPEALDQPVRFAIALGEQDKVPPPRREKILLAAQERQPSHFLVLMALSNLETLDPSERPTEGVGWSRAALALRPTNAGVWNQLGAALSIQGDPDGALAAYRQALRFDPKLAWAHSNLGNILRVKGNLDGALAAYHEALRCDPKLAGTYNNLGITLQAKGDLDGAIAAYRASLQLEPDSAKVHGNLGIALTHKGDLDGAVAAYREAIRLNPRAARTHFNLGVALQTKGDLDGAIAAYAESRRLEPENPRRQRALDLTLKLKAESDAQAPSDGGRT